MSSINGQKLGPKIQPKPQKKNLAKPKTISNQPNSTNQLSQKQRESIPQTTNNANLKIKPVTPEKIKFNQTVDQLLEKLHQQSQINIGKSNGYYKISNLRNDYIGIIDIDHASNSITYESGGHQSFTIETPSDPTNPESISPTEFFKMLKEIKQS
jgi:predicted acetyltransferase